MLRKVITDFYRFNPKFPTNFWWPKDVSYQNPIRAIKYSESGVWF
jgi:hypothetical protein